MRLSRSTDFLTGCFFLALGGFVLIYGTRYAMGSAVRMGPGYFPRLASSGLVLLGVILVVRSFVREAEPVGGVRIRPLFCVLLASLAFGLLIEGAGFWPASVALVVASRFAERDVRILEVGALAVFLAALMAAIFRYGLGLPMRMLPF
ncbi:MAG TPA: tripartite tricarboxylate transporter TctB family protein [Candidatus Methylomirabilis sp.]|nr:tripartite tricarboxylate transporter TctB family protein [Candidatus Methylomirabilis sp.]